LIIAAAVVIVVVLVAIGIVPLDWRWILLALAGFMGFLAFIASLQRSDMTKNPRLAGSQVALSLYEEELKREGFSTWQDEDLYRSIP
jgi:cell division protein FtsW (lipid II flippase)